MTTHRPVIQDPTFTNRFWSLDLEGRVTFDGHVASPVELANMLDETEREFDLHAESGASDLCEICQRKTVNQAMEERRDELDRILRTVPPTHTLVEALIQELAEIYVHIGRNPDDWQAEAEAQAADQRDQSATIESVRPF